MDSNWKKLADLTLPNSEMGPIVPVLGTGFRRWVTNNEMSEPFYSWKALIEFIAWGQGRPARVPAGEASLSSVFEDLILRVARGNQAPHHAEDALIKGLALQWEPSIQAARESQTFRNRWSEFRAAHSSSPMIDLNIDRLLVGDERFPRPRMGTINFCVDGHTIWYPHGVASKTGNNNAVTLSTQRYGQAVRRLTDNLSLGIDAATDHWIGVGLRHPLVLLGVGLGPDEWDLWWLLHMRGRYWLNRNCPPVFRLTCRQDVHEKTRSVVTAGVDIIPLDGGDTWDEAWETYLRFMNLKLRGRA